MASTPGGSVLDTAATPRSARGASTFAQVPYPPGASAPAASQVPPSTPVASRANAGAVPGSASRLCATSPAVGAALRASSTSASALRGLSFADADDDDDDDDGAGAGAGDGHDPEVVRAMDFGGGGGPRTPKRAPSVIESSAGGGASRPVTPGRGSEVVDLGQRHIVSRAPFHVPAAAAEALSRAASGADGAAGASARGPVDAARFQRGIGLVVVSPRAYVWLLHSRSDDCWTVNLDEDLGDGNGEGDGGWDADSVCVVPGPIANGPPTLAAVSRSGRGVYVPDVSATGSASAYSFRVDGLDAAAGETVRVVADAYPVGFAAATSRGRLLHLRHVSASSSPYGPITAILPPKSRGVLAGIGRILSLAIGGGGGGGGSGSSSSNSGGDAAGRSSSSSLSSPTGSSGTVRLCTRPTSRGTCEVLLLTDDNLEKWDLAAESSGGARFAWSHPVRESLAAPFADTAWAEISEAARAEGRDPGQFPELRIWPLDVHVCGSEGLAIVLAASVQTNVPEEEQPIVTYTFAEYDVSVDPPTFVEGGSLANELLYDPERHDALVHDVRFVAPRGGPAAYVLTAEGVVLTRVPFDDVDELDAVVPPPSSREPQRYVGFGTVGRRCCVLAAGEGDPVCVVVRGRRAERGLPPRRAGMESALDTSDLEPEMNDAGGDADDGDGGETAEHGYASDGADSLGFVEVDDFARADEDDDDLVVVPGGNKHLYRTPVARRTASRLAEITDGPGAAGRAGGADRDTIAATVSAAVDLHMRGQAKAAADVVASRVVAEGATTADVSAAAIMVSASIADATPDENPLWASVGEASGTGAARERSVMIHARLAAKRARHAALATVLTAARASRLVNAGARAEIASHAERLAAAASLRAFENHKEDEFVRQRASASASASASAIPPLRVLRRAMASVVAESGGARPGWSVDDEFYARATRVGDVVASAAAEADAAWRSAPSDAARAEAVAEANDVAAVVVVAASSQRYAGANAYADGGEADSAAAAAAAAAEAASAEHYAALGGLRLSPSGGVAETRPWMRSRKFVSALDTLSRRTVDALSLGSLPRDAAPRLVDQLAVLADARLRAEADRIVDGEVDSTAFEPLRRAVIAPFEIRDREHAMALAERYTDFAALARLTAKDPPADPSASVSGDGLGHGDGGGDGDDSRSAERARLLRELGDRGYALALHELYLERGQIVEMLAACNSATPASRAALSRLLEPHPDLHWIMLLKTGDPGAASGVLSGLAGDGVSDGASSLGERRTLLSLAKLASSAAASSPSPSLTEDGEQPTPAPEISARLTVTEMQAHIEARELAATGTVDADDLAAISGEVDARKVRSPEDIIATLIDRDATAGAGGMHARDHERYHCALHIARASAAERSPADQRAVLVEIWRAAISIDVWKALATRREAGEITDTVLWQAIEQSVFFTTAKRCAAEGNTDLLATDIMDDVLEPFDEESTVRRIINTAHRMVLQSAGHDVDAAPLAGPG